MLKNNFAFLANYLWRESIQNMEKYLTPGELGSFSSNDYYYLTTIYHLGRPNFSRVAEALRLTKPAISAIIRKLIRLGLLAKIQSEMDRRVYYLELTEKGKQIIAGDEALYGRVDALIKELVASDDSYTFVADLLAEMVKRLNTKEVRGVR